VRHTINSHAIFKRDIKNKREKNSSDRCSSGIGSKKNKNKKHFFIEKAIQNIFLAIQNIFLVIQKNFSHSKEF